MITIRDLFMVTPAIALIDVTIYDTTQPLCYRKIARLLIGWPEGHCFPRHLQWEIDNGIAEALPVRVNTRDYPGSDGRFGLQPGVLPDELLDAPVFSLQVDCRDWIQQEIEVSVAMQTQSAESALAWLRGKVRQ